MPEIFAWPERPPDVGFADLAELWNAGAAGRHAFFPWTADLLARQLDPAAGWEAPGLFAARGGDGRLLGAAQATFVGASTGYDPAGAVELLVVRPEARRHGLGGALLARALDRLRARGAPFADALGAWPYGPHFHALADGSERSGVFDGDAAAGACFAAAGFADGRASRVMRVDLSAPGPWADAALPPDTRVFEGPRERESTWLDHSFRAWSLDDHVLADARDRTILSRAIHGRMDGLSDYTGVEHRALFGVYTNPWGRRRGWARANLAALLRTLAARGVRVVELHCYADNAPALGLYERLGFAEAARTRMMRRTL